MESQSSETGDKSRTPYSCKRCRRLKKKCTRTMPECLNCHKAGEVCEYVARAPRRKKSEVLQSFNELKGRPAALLPPKAGGITKPLNSAVPRYTVKSLLNEPPQPQRLHHIQPLGCTNHHGVLPASESSPMYPRVPLLETSTEPLSRPAAQYSSEADQNRYTQDTTPRASHGALPPISSLTNSVQPLHLQHLAQQSLPLQQQQRQHYAQHSQAQLSAHQKQSQQQQQQQQQQKSSVHHYQQPYLHRSSIANDTTSSKSAKSSISSNDSHPQQSPKTSSFKYAAASEASILSNTLGINQPSTQNSFQEVRPELNFALVMRCIESFFSNFGKSFPFIRKAEYVNRLQSFDLFQIDQMPPHVTFDLFMVIFIGFTALERKGKIPANETLKGYLRHRSLERAPKVITYSDIESVKNLLLLGLYSYFDVDGTASWYIGGIITRLALSLNLNRRASFKNNLKTEEEAEMMNRLFWSVYNYDRQTSLMLNRPVGIRDDDINVDMPRVLSLDEEDDIQLMHATINLRRLEGKIQQAVHSVNAGSKFKTTDARAEFMISMRSEIEDWYKQVTSIAHSSRKLTSTNSITTWYSLSYYQLIMILYRPSFLTPNPSHETLVTVGKACLQSLTNSYNLYQIHLLPLTWVQLSVMLNISTTLAHCLCKWAVDFTEFDAELDLGQELFEFFGSRWSVAKSTLRVVRQFNHIIYRANLDRSQWSEAAKYEIVGKFIDLTHDYHQILVNNQADVWFDDPIIANIAV